MKQKFFTVMAITAPVLLLVLAGFLGIYDFRFLEAKVSSADCVQCKAEAGCRVCKGGGDANSCMTGGDCESCVEIGICPPSGDFADGEICKKTDLHSGQNVKLPVQTIREIAAVHPRFAATLARINVDGFDNEHYRVRWTPLEMRADDVERYLNPKNSSDDLSQSRNAEVMRINRLIEEGLEADLIHRVTIEEVDASTKLFRIQVVKGFALDPNYSTLELKYTFVDELSTAGGAKEAKTEWRVF